MVMNCLCHENGPGEPRGGRFIHPNLLFDWTVTWLNCYLTELLLYWTVTWLNCYFTELLLDWTVSWLNCYLTEPLLDWTVNWTVTWLNCYLTELLLDWSVNLLSCYFSWLFAFLNLRNSEVSHLNFLWQSLHTLTAFSLFVSIFECKWTAMVIKSHQRTGSPAC